MNRYAFEILTTIFIFTLGPNISNAASFNCNKARTKVEKSICGNAQLSNLDDELSVIYTKSRSIAFEDAKLKKQQLKWLKKRDKCTDVDCLVNAYESRIKDLVIYVGKYNQTHDLEAHYISDRSHLIKRTLENKPLYMILDKVIDNPACTSFRTDFKGQKNVNLIAPIARAHEYNYQILSNYLPRCDIKSLVGMAGTYGESNYNLYRINDNIYVLETEKLNKKQYNYEEKNKQVNYVLYRKKTHYKTLNANTCQTIGSYTDDKNINEDRLREHPGYLDSPEIAINGIVKYQGKYYIYKLSEKHVPNHPLSVYSLKYKDPDNTLSGNMFFCIYDHRHPSNFETREERAKRHNALFTKLRTPTEIGRLKLGPNIGTAKVITQLVGDTCKLTFRTKNGTAINAVELNPKNWCPDPRHFKTFDPNQDGYEDFVTVFTNSAPFTFNQLWMYEPHKNKFVVDSSFPGGWPSDNTCVYGETRTGVGGGEHVYGSYKYCYDKKTNNWNKDN